MDTTVSDGTIEALDGRPLAVTRYAPASDKIKGSILVNSALATPRGFYDTFADWLSSRGYRVTTFDFRGIGDSTGTDDSSVRIEEWATKDVAGILDWIREKSPSDPIYVIGHSMGGQIMGLLGDRFRIDAMATFSAQSGYWRIQYPGERIKLLLASYVIFPAIVYTFGYLPWSYFFGGDDIPRSVALQWCSWCRNPDYLLGDDTIDNRDDFGNFEAPIVAYSFEDDRWGWKQSVDWMTKQYTNANTRRKHVKPREVGVESIGHFGFFRSDKEKLWKELLDELKAVS